jgi:hypothetical protein
MKFLHNSDCSLEMHFEQDELDIINRTKKLTFDPTASKHLTNVMFSVMVEIQANFAKKDPELSKLITTGNEEIKGS